MAIDLQPVFDALRNILRRHARSFSVKDRKGFYALEDHSIRGHLVDFAAVVAKPRAISFYMMSPVFMPELDALIPKALLPYRMKAKFFNFKTVEPKRFAELAKLVARFHRDWDPQAVIDR
jgi:hypothetical protein